MGCPLQPDLVNTSCSGSCALDAVLACGRAVHLTHELVCPPFCLHPICPPTSISIRVSLEIRDSYDASSRYETFISEDWPTKPDGFCERAWPDIRHEVAMVMYGSTVPWVAEGRFTITCCNDGLRPVIFRIERVEDGERR